MASRDNNTPLGLRLTTSQLAEIAAVLGVHRRHLAAISVHALSVGLPRQPRQDAHGIVKCELEVADEVRQALGYAALPASQRTLSTGLDPAMCPGHPGSVLNIVLEAYVGNESPQPVPRFPDATADADLTVELYGHEMHSCVWRLAIECVKEREFALAEALFTLHLLLEHPDLYLVFFDARVPETLEEVLDSVCAAATSRSSTAAPRFDHVNVGRMWASLYARRLCFVRASDYPNALARCSIEPSPEILTMLTGLNATTPCIVQGGCVPYHLDIETKTATPVLGLVRGLSLVSNGNDDGRVFESLVMQAHALRLVLKPLVDQRWQASETERINFSQAPPAKAPDSVRAAAAASNAALFAGLPLFARDDLQRHIDDMSVRGIEPHMIRLGDLTHRLLSLSTITQRTFDRAPRSFVRYGTDGVTVPEPFGASVLKRFAPDTYRKLRQKDTSHTNFYATIECGRLMALLHNVSTGRHTAQSFATAYLKECAELAQLDTQQIRLDAAQSSWLESTGSGRRRHEDELVLNNLQSPTAEHACAALHRRIHASLNNGELDMPTGFDIVPRVTINGSTRFATPSLTGSALRSGLRALCRFHAPMAAGCGTLTTPHVGITAAVVACTAEQSVALLPGQYEPFRLLSVHGTVTRPLVIAPASELAQVLRDLDVKQKPKHERDEKLEPSSDEGRIIDFREPTATADGSLTCSISRPLRPGAESTFGNDGSSALIVAERSSHIRIARCHLRGAPLAVDAIDCHDFEVVNCKVMTDAPFRTTTGECHVVESSNEVISTTNRLVRMLWAGDLPQQVIVPGYVLSLGVYVMFAFLCLFLTAAFDDATATEWVIRSVVTTAIVALIIQPVTAMAAATFSFVNTIIFAAFNQLRAFTPAL